METLPSFQSLLDSTTTTTAVETNASSHHPVGHYPLADVGSSPFFSSSSSFFSSSSSFFSSSGELSGLLASSSSSSSSSRRGRESPVSPSSPPCQTGPSNAPLASFLGSFTMSTTTTTHTTTAPPSAFKPVGHGLAPAPCTLPLGQALLPGPSSVTATSAASAMLPFHASAHSHALSQSVLPLTSDARAIKKKDCGAHTATAVHAAAGSSGKPGVRVCTMCGTSKTKQWRSGSDGKPSLCNACGLRYRKDSLGQKFKFKQVIIFPSGTTRASGSNNNKKRKALATSDDKNKADSVDEKELTASLAAAKSASKKRRHASPAAAAADQHDTRSREISPDRRSDIYSLLN